MKKTFILIGVVVFFSLQAAAQVVLDLA